LAAGARQILHDDIRMPRDVTANVPRQQAGINVVSATGFESDNQIDGLALVEIFHALRRGRARQKQSEYNTGTGA
jgi:hypothetical protein